jgi:hypothetical protein
MVKGKLIFMVSEALILMVTIGLIFMVKNGLSRRAGRIDRAKPAD